jgi:hypothetical protein
MDIRNVKPVGSSCVACHGQTNVVIEGWTLDGPLEIQQWTCPRCRVPNTILTQGTVVGVAIATVEVISGKPVGTV